MTKKTLYHEVTKLSQSFGIDIVLSNYPVDALKIAALLCRNPRIDGNFDFKDRRIGGLTIMNKCGTSIFLNKEHSNVMKNFNCMHELIHCFFHAKIKECSQNVGISFVVSEKGIISQDDFYEWEANEGAAQFLVPYQLFIPLYVEKCIHYAKNPYESKTETELAKLFGVSVSVIRIRIKSLEYEILQFKHGVPIEKIKIMSKTQADKDGWTRFTLSHKYCVSCLAFISHDGDFCHICGENLRQKSKTGIPKTIVGEGYLVYKSSDKTETFTCPKCQNSLTGVSNYCFCCGTKR